MNLFAGAPVKYLTVAEFAAVMRVTPQTVRNLIGRGDLRAERVGAA